MPTHLKLRKTSNSPEMYIAFEYESPTYLSYARTTKFPNIRWQSGELGTDAVAKLLQDRGWHTTDIGDELHEARQHSEGAV